MDSLLHIERTRWRVDGLLHIERTRWGGGVDSLSHRKRALYIGWTVFTYRERAMYGWAVL